METKNAIIESTMLGYEDHGIVTVFLNLSYGSNSQGFGGHALDTPIRIKDEFSHREGTAFGMQYIIEILEVVGVQKWEDLKGKHIRVVSSDEGIVSIGNIIKDNWFTPKILVNKFNKGK